MPFVFPHGKLTTVKVGCEETTFTAAPGSMAQLSTMFVQPGQAENGSLNFFHFQDRFFDLKN